jgi:hypothetical protein
MRSSPKLASAALALSIVFLSFVSSAFVEPKEEVAAATLAWGQALGEDDPEKVLPFYANDAVLWGTLSPTVPTELRDETTLTRVHHVARWRGCRLAACCARAGVQESPTALLHYIRSSYLAVNKI